MRPTILVGTVFIAGILAVGTVAMSGDGGSPVRESATIYLAEPTLIGSAIVGGAVLFTHDNAKMARGEPCTTISRVEPVHGRTEEIASFRCIPTPRTPVPKFTITTRPNAELGVGCVLTEFQFAGDLEGHGVPDSLSALASSERSTETRPVQR